MENPCTICMYIIKLRIKYVFIKSENLLDKN